MYNGPISRPVAMQCNACGTTGNYPRSSKVETKDQILTESKWCCIRCGNYFHKAITAVVNKEQPTK